jgi:hypothetical protein
MEIKVKFTNHLRVREETEQEISVQHDPKYTVELQQKALMQQMLSQYASVGMLRQPSPNFYKLILPSQIAIVECELGSLVIADMSEVPRITLE